VLVKAFKKADNARSKIHGSVRSGISLERRQEGVTSVPRK
jgi:hypothetical protein